MLNNMIEYKVIKHVNKNDYPETMINYVIYSHSSFLDILQIQTDYISGRGHLTLFINDNDSDLTEIYSKYDKVVFYDDNLSYGNKLLSCIKQIDYDYFLLVHDNDIVYHADNERLLELLSFLKNNNFDRIDFQLAYDFDRAHKDKINDDDLYLIKSSNTDTTANGYIYNVNPSIWKREALIEILVNHGYRDYRTIEHPDVQKFCLRYDIFKLFSKKVYRCGYFICLEPFRYLHITHSQKLLSFNNLPNGSYTDIQDVYIEIINKYNLKNSNKWIG